MKGQWNLVNSPLGGGYFLGEVPPKRGDFFRLEVYKRVEISRVEV